jgi:hypothetical protein
MCYLQNPFSDLVFSFASASCKQQCTGRSNRVLEAKVKGESQKCLSIPTALRYIALQVSINYHSE